MITFCSSFPPIIIYGQRKQLLHQIGVYPFEVSRPVQIISCISDPDCVFWNEAIGSIHVHVETKITLRDHHIKPAVTFKENMHPRSFRNICNLSVKPSCTGFQVCLSDCFCNRKRIIQVTCRHSNVINTNVL